MVGLRERLATADPYGDALGEAPVDRIGHWTRLPARLRILERLDLQQVPDDDADDHEDGQEEEDETDPVVPDDRQGHERIVRDRGGAVEFSRCRGGATRG